MSPSWLEGLGYEKAGYCVVFGEYYVFQQRVEDEYGKRIKNEANGLASDAGIARLILKMEQMQHHFKINDW